MNEKMCKSCSHQIVCLHASRDIKGCAYYEKYEEPRPHGEWIDRSDDGRIRCPFWERYECSKCGAKSENTNFCPKCGARMKAGDPNDTV